MKRRRWLEDRFEKRIVRLEDKNEKLTQELSDARGTIVDLKGEINQLHNSLLMLRESATTKKRPNADAVNGKSMNKQLIEAGELLIRFLLRH